MKKSFKLDGLDCANCAAKIESSIKKLDGVHNATVNFLTQRVTIDADDTRFDDILPQISAICHKIEPGCAISW